jgi:hypothetical protein
VPEGLALRGGRLRERGGLHGARRGRGRRVRRVGRRGRRSGSEGAAVARRLLPRFVVERGPARRVLVGTAAGVCRRRGESGDGVGVREEGCVEERRVEEGVCGLESVDGDVKKRRKGLATALSGSQ